MKTFEKIYSLFAIFFAIALTLIMIVRPEFRELKYLLIASSAGLVINVVLMFIVLRDIFLRQPFSKKEKFFWTGLLLIVWPAIPVYLAVHGFRNRAVA